MVLFYILAKLSERFGSVLKMPPLYKWYSLAQLFLGIALVAHLLQAIAFVAGSPVMHGQPTSGSLWYQPANPAFSILFYQFPLAIGLTVGLVITWKYWGWLITERKN